MSVFITSVAAVLGLLLVGTGVHLYIVGAPSVALHLSQWVHVVAGLVFVAPVLMSLWRHRSIRGNNAVGLSAAAALLLVIVTGVVVSAMAATGYVGPGWLIPVHDVASLVLGVAVVVHTVAALRKRPKAKWTRRFAIPAAVAMVLALASTAGLTMLLDKSATGSTTVEGYSTPFDSKPFTPANVALDREGFVDRSRLAGSLACKTCHADIYRQWSESMHRHSATDPHVDTGIRWFQRDNGVESGRLCAGCHNPIGLLAGDYDPSQTHEEIGTPPHDEGISCLVCHQTVHVGEDPLGNGSYQLRVPKLASVGADWVTQTSILLDPKGHAADMLSPVQRTPLFCASCHQQYTPESLGGDGPAASHSQYVEWLESPYAAEGAGRKTCNDCHMPLVPSDDPSADAEGRVRSHRFLGGNHGHAVASGYEEQAAGQLAMLQSGLAFKVETVRSEKPGHLGVAVTVANTGVGHRFPSGTTDLSETWLEVTLGDAEAPIYNSGALDEAHYLDPDAKQWRTVFVDSSNVPVDLHNLAIVAKTTVDDYIAPGKEDRTVYDIPVPTSAPESAALRVRLRMRKTNQRWNDWLTNFDGTTVPVTDVFEDSRTVDLRAFRRATKAVVADRRQGPVEPSPPGMAFVPAGLTVIGSDEGDADETPVRDMYVEGFHIDVHPVTNEQYRRFLVATNRPGPVHRLEWAVPYNWSGQQYPTGTGQRAAVLITHEEAAAYCRWVGKRLPREVEWEKAARGPNGQRYPWGEEWARGDCAAVEGQDIPPRVGMCPERKSPYGVQDLVGSTWEWVDDYYFAYDRTHLHPNANEWITSFGDPSYALRGVPAGHAGPGTTGASRAGHADNMRAKIGFRCASDARSPEARGRKPKTADRVRSESSSREGNG